MVKTYQLAIIGTYDQTQYIGPMLTLAQAEYYRDQMALGGFNVTVKNRAWDYDCSLATKGRKVWQRFSLLTM